MPKIEKLNLKELKNASGADHKSKSLFAQNLERQGQLKSHFALNRVYQVNTLKNNEQLKQVEQRLATEKAAQTAINVENSRPRQIITGEGLGNRKDVEQIHLENLEFLSRMQPEEILAEQQKLIQQLDPKVLAFIRRKSNAANSDRTKETLNSSNASSDFSQRFNKEEFLEQLPFKPDKKWLHMDKIEYDKLEWMTKTRNVVKINPNEEENRTPSKARFDFEGNLIAPDQDVPVTKALHHHGNEPDQVIDQILIYYSMI